METSKPDKQNSHRAFNDSLHKIVTVEPVMFLYIFSSLLMDPVVTALIYKKMCVVNFNETVCDNLKNFTVEEDHVQQETSYWSVVLNICCSVPPLLVTPLYGAWSDRYGRKLIMTFPLFGQALAAVGYGISSYFMKSHVGLILVAGIIGNTLGNFTGLSMSMFSYLADVVEPKDRTFRNAVLSAMIMVGRVAGSAACGVMLDKLGYISVFGTSVGILLTGTLYIGVWLRNIKPSIAESLDTCTELPLDSSTKCQEALELNHASIGADCSITLSDTQEATDDSEKTPKSIKKKKNICQQLFNINTLAGSVRVFMKKRVNNHRFHLLLQFSILASLTVFDEVIPLQYLFLRRRPLSWDQTTYGYYGSVGAATRLVCLLLLVPILKKKFNTRDTVMAGIGVFSVMATNILFAFSKFSWMAFLSNGLCGFGNVAYMCMRSLMSRMVDSNEQGQMSALVAVVQEAGGMLAFTLFSVIYPETLSWFAGFLFLFTGILHLVPLTSVVILHYDMNKYGVQGMISGNKLASKTKTDDSDSANMTASE